MTLQSDIEDRRVSEWFDDIITDKNCSCKNCQWSGYEKGDLAITCGHHLQNFSPDSSCASWTDPKDVDLIEHREKRKKELMDKLGKKQVKN